MAPPAGFNSTMHLPKRQLNKRIVLIEFVIYGGLRTPWVSLGTSFSSPLSELLVGLIGSIVNSGLANDSKKLAL